MSLFDIFKSNADKIAEQEQQILALQMKIADGEEHVIALEEEAVKTKEKITAKEEDVIKLNRQIAKIQSDKKLEIEERDQKNKMFEEKLQHNLKIKMEAVDIEKEKAIMEVKAKSAEEVAAVKDKYQDKMEKQLQAETKSIKEMYSQILTRLPNLNAKLNISEKTSK